MQKSILVCFCAPQCTFILDKFSLQTPVAAVETD